jgi:tetratricopeptide (TPR) repeat protein
MVRAGSSWRVLIFHPGEDPIGHLAASLNSPSVLGVDAELASTNKVLLEATLRRGSLGLVESVRLARIPSRDNLLVVVDQFEELFRFRKSRQIENSRDEAAAFLKLLLDATRQEDLPIYVVLTMRSDFIGDCMEFEGLPEAVNAGLYLVPRMTRDELRSAITGPVAVGGGEISQRLVLRLLNDVGGDHDQLPLLQHALMRSWDHWETHPLSGESIDIGDFEAVGTLEHALSLHAEEAYDEAGFYGNQHIAEKVFKALTDTFSDPRGVRRPTSVQQLAAICQAPEDEIIKTIDLFRRQGRSFLTPSAETPLDSQSIIDLSHESFMRCWQRLSAWAEQERESAGSYFRIAQAASWHEHATGSLWVDPQLETGLQWRRENQPTAAWAERYEPNFTQAMDFLDRSERQREAEREKERRRRLTLQVVTSVLAMLLLIVGFLLQAVRVRSSRAEHNLELAKRAVDESLSSVGSQQAREAADMPQMDEMRRQLLDKAKVFYHTLARQEPKREKFSKEVALAHSRLGDIDRLLEMREDAVREYKESISEFEILSRANPQIAEYRQLLAYCHNWLGETLRTWLEESQQPFQYTTSDAEKEYDAALSLQQALQAQRPDYPDYKQELARTYYNRGILNYDSHSLDAAWSDFRHAIALLEPLARKNDSSSQETKSTPNPAQELARVYNNLGLLLEHLQRAVEARDYLERAIATDEELMTEQPDNREYKQELAQFYENLALLMVNENLFALADKRNHQALDLIEDLATPPHSLDLERAKAHMLRGRIMESQELGKAQLESKQSFDILQKMSKSRHPHEHSEFHVLYMHLGDNYVELAKKYLDSGDLADAQATIESLSHLLPELVTEDRDRLTESYHELQKALQEKQAVNK